MATTKNIALVRMIGSLALAMAALPAVSLGQAQGGRGAGGGAGAMGNLAQARQVLAQMDLTGDEKTKIDDAMKKALQDMRDSRQNMQDATPDERRQKMQDLAKEADDTMDQIQTNLTPEHKAAFAPKYATAVITRLGDTLVAIQKSSATLDLGDDQKKQLSTIVDDTTKTIDSYKSDAGSVKDYPAAVELTTKANQTMTDARRQLVELLGREQAQKLMRSAAQSMAGVANGAGGRRRANAGRGNAGGGNAGGAGPAGTTAKPTTEPTK